MITHAYGQHRDQFIEISLPQGDPRGVIAILHGGFWRAAYDASLGRPLAADLAARGWLAYNIEYRRVGSGGGWPATFNDVADAIDLMADLEVDTSKLLAVGHSAGGHLAAWLAGRISLPPTAPGASPRVTVTGVVAQAGVLDLRTAALTNVGATACSDFLGGYPEQVPERYALADPMMQLPLPVPLVCVHSRGDDSVPFSQSEMYTIAARAAGADAELLEVPGDHMAHADPQSEAWRVAVDELSRLTRS